ncbi:hypothetical protein D3C81_1171420 [compost metagenome]
MIELFDPCLQGDARTVCHRLSGVVDLLVKNAHRLCRNFKIAFYQLVVEVVRSALAKDAHVFDQKVGCAVTHIGVLAAALAGCVVQID